MRYLYILTVVVCVWAGGVLGQDDWCEVNGLRLSKGETWQEKGHCVQATCQGNNASTALGCALLLVDNASGWTLSEEDLTKPYPDCCPQPISPANTNTPQPPQCVEDGQVYLEGEQKDIPGWCGANICTGDNSWSFMPCGLVAEPEGWTTLPEDPSKPYPECCARAVPIENGDSNPTNSISTSATLPSDNENYVPSEPQQVPEAVDSDQVTTITGDLSTLAKDESEYWTQADDSVVQNVRSTFPNDQAGLKRLMESIPKEDSPSADSSQVEDVPTESASSEEDNSAANGGSDKDETQESLDSKEDVDVPASGFASVSWLSMFK